MLIEISGLFTFAALGNFRDAGNTDSIAELNLKHGKIDKMELTEYHKVDTEHAKHTKNDDTEATE